jgi:hypothetical protein
MKYPHFHQQRFSWGSDSAICNLRRFTAYGAL